MRQDYRLLVLDLDGTLTNSKKEISPRNLRTLLHLQQSGVRLVLASGRPTYGIAPLAEQLKMKDYITVECTRRQDAGSHRLDGQCRFLDRRPGSPRRRRPVKGRGAFMAATYRYQQKGGEYENVE